MKYFRIALLAGLALCLAACSSQSTPEEPPMAQPSLPPDLSGLEPLIEAAKADLAARLSIPTSEISLVAARMVVWPDSSLGCPQPGMKYLQVPEDGAQIILAAAGREYDYHNGGKRGLFLCENN